MKSTVECCNGGVVKVSQIEGATVLNTCPRPRGKSNWCHTHSVQGFITMSEQELIILGGGDSSVVRAPDS